MKKEDKAIEFTYGESRAYPRMKVNSRKFKDTIFPVWSAVQECEEESCIAFDICPIAPFMRSKCCAVIVNYLKHLEKMVYAEFGNDMSDFEFYKVGMHLIPLYKQLARLKIMEMTISSSVMVETAKSGLSKIHPVFKEIRECVRSINTEWKELGIGCARRIDAPDLPKEPGEGYYEEMERSARTERNASNKLKELKLVKRNG